MVLSDVRCLMARLWVNTKVLIFTADGILYGTPLTRFSDFTPFLRYIRGLTFEGNQPPAPC